jgi:transposase
MNPDNTPDAIRRLVNKLTGKYQQLLFCYEAGPTGYGLHRQITAFGHECSVIAPSLIPRRPGEHVKAVRLLYGSNLLRRPALRHALDKPRP